MPEPTAAQPPTERLAAFWELSQELLAIADLDGDFLHVNPRWKDVTGWSREELVSRPFLEFVHPADRERTRAEIEQMVEEGQASVSFENRYLCADDGVVHLRWSSTTVREQGLIYAMATDVTSERRSEVRLRRARERALQAERDAVATERRFLSMLTHELRNPVASIRGFATLLASHWEELPEVQRRDFVDHVERASGRLQRLTTEFLRLAEHHEQGFQPRTHDVDLRELVEGVVGDLGEAVPDVRVEAPDPARARLDPDFTRQCLANLLTNAAKYGGPPIEVTVDPPPPEGTGAIAVRDHGPGVPREFVPHLFRRFARAERGPESTGLGLSIARDLARAQGGDLHYEPADPGSRFVLAIPA